MSHPRQPSEKTQTHQARKAAKNSWKAVGYRKEERKEAHKPNGSKALRVPLCSSPFPCFLFSPFAPPSFQEETKRFIDFSLSLFCFPLQKHMQPAPPSAASPTAPVAGGGVFVKVEKRDLLRYLGNRVRIELDDNTIICGRLVSVSASGNVVLTDAERERSRKRRRGEESAYRTAKPAVSWECYASVIFLRGSCISGVYYTSGLTTDKAVVSQVTGGRDGRMSRAIEMANASPAVGFSRA